MNEELREKLIAAEEYRTFLGIVAGSRGGYAAFSRRADFSSRSFLSEVLRGHRRLSHSSYQKVAKALKLPPDLQNLFHLLVAREEPDVASVTDRLSLESKIAALREKLKRSKSSKAKELFDGLSVAVVYAALGERTEGSTLKQILVRTKLRTSEAQQALEFIVSKNLAEQINERYFALEGDVDLFDLEGMKSFRETFAESANTLGKLVRDADASPKNLFFFTAFPVSDESLSALKQELREAALSVIEKYQCESGESVVRLNLGYFS